MNLITALARLLIFPAFCSRCRPHVLPLGRTQGRCLDAGPHRAALHAAFYDFIKLLGKTTPLREGIGGLLMKAWPLLAVSSAAGAVALLPVLPSSGGFEGDLILLLALLEVPSMCIIAAGFSSRSIFGEIGSAREAVLSVSYNVVFLLAIVSIAASQHTFRLEALAQLPASPLRWLGVLAILVCLPAKLHLNPFSLPNAEQEIYSGPMVEYAGPNWRCGTFAWAGVGGRNRTRATLPLPCHPVVDCRTDLRRALVCHRSAAVDTGLRYGAAGDRYHGALLLQCTLIFAVLAISSVLFMRLRS